MREVVRPWAMIMLVDGGLFTGGMVWYAWERVWIWRRLSLNQFAVDFRRSVRTADPAMPILLVVCGAAAGVFASLVEGGARTLALLGVGLLVVILAARSSLRSRSTVSSGAEPKEWCRPTPSTCGACGVGSISSARERAWPP